MANITFRPVGSHDCTKEVYVFCGGGRGGHYHYVTDDIFNRGTEPDATDNLNCKIKMTHMFKVY